MNNIINFSEGFLISIHALIALHKSKGDKALCIQEISKKLKVSESHLAKIMQKLVKQKIVSSTRGPKGGFKLQKKLSKINLMELYISIEGPIGNLDCKIRSDYCTENCQLKKFHNSINNQILNFLKNTNVANTNIVDIEKSD